MNKSFVKFVTDFGPLVVFFSYYYNSGKDLRVAIPPFIIATIIALIVVYFSEKKIVVIKEVIVPGAYLIVPIPKKVINK